MIHKKHRKKMLRQLDSLIGQQTQIDGNVTFTGGLRVDGTITGNVSAADEEENETVLTLSESGTIEGDIHVPYMIVNGTIIGNLYATEHLELAEKTRITGNVYYNLLQMKEGAEINGNLIHTQKKENPTPANKDKKSENKDEHSN